MIIKASLWVTKEDVKRRVQEIVENPPDALINEVIEKMQNIATAWGNAYLQDLTSLAVSEIIDDLYRSNVKI